MSLALCQTHPGTILLKTFYEDDIKGNSFFPIVVNEKKGTGTKPSETTALGEKYWKGGRQNIGEGDTDIGKEDEEYYT